MTATKSIKSPNSPAFLQLIKWIVDPLGYMNSAVRNCGDIFAAKVFRGGELVYVSHPEAMKVILTRDTKELFAPGEINQIFKPLLGNYSIILMSSARHQRERKLLMPPFHGTQIQNYAQLIVNLTEQVMNQLTPGENFTARGKMQEISLQVIIEAVFGLHEGENYRKLSKLITEMFELFSSPATSAFLFFPWLQKDWGVWSPWGNFLSQQRQIDEIIYAEIKARRANPDPHRNDILTLLLAARDEAGEPMTDTELRDELLTLLFAGHETTATAMAWSLYWVHRFPEIKQKLLAELASLGENPDPMAIYRLPYLTAVCQETLRIYPVGMLTFPREVISPIKIMNHEFEPGTVLIGSIYSTHQREDLYPEPHKFKPERFLERQYSAYEYLPFGGGARRCIGYALAEMEMRLVLATILANYQLDLATQKPVKPARRGLTLAPAGGVKMVMKSKQKISNNCNEPIVSRRQL
ncbi:MAG: cytochrome P450 [Oscillatoria sp. PMC 1068.18]|nr:cytochrome P450 [Oscillatoria sp. PMC 1076.18]MEC4990985.1 cytochrome P450 [Oscillatoria sp. PMC 1068.18]